MRNSDTKPYTRAAAGLTLLDRPEHFRVVPTQPVCQVPSQLSDNPQFITRRNGHDHLIRGEYLGQEHGFNWNSMGPNLIRALGRGNVLV